MAVWLIHTRSSPRMAPEDLRQAAEMVGVHGTRTRDNMEQESSEPSNRPTVRSRGTSHHPKYSR